MIQLHVAEHYAVSLTISLNHGDADNIRIKRRYDKNLWHRPLLKSLILHAIRSIKTRSKRKQDHKINYQNPPKLIAERKRGNYPTPAAQLRPSQLFFFPSCSQSRADSGEFSHLQWGRGLLLYQVNPAQPTFSNKTLDTDRCVMHHHGHRLSCSNS